MFRTSLFLLVVSCGFYSFLAMAEIQFPTRISVKDSPYKLAELNLVQDGRLTLTIETNHDRDEVGLVGTGGQSGASSISLDLNNLLPQDEIFPNFVTTMFPYRTLKGETYVIIDSKNNAYLIQFENSSSSLDATTLLEKLFPKKINKTIVRLLPIGKITPQFGILTKSGLQPFESIVDSLVTTSRCQTWLMGTN